MHIKQLHMPIVYTYIVTIARLAFFNLKKQKKIIKKSKKNLNISQMGYILWILVL